jgi:Na+/melibiose symporter-like transporter
VFFTLFLVAYTGYNIVCCAIPDMVYRMVPADTVAAFHTWRMAFTTLGSVISTAVIGMISVFVPGYCILAGGAAAILICSAWYYFYYKKTYQS